MIDQVSLDNYAKFKDTRLNKRESEVYNALRDMGGGTSWDILNFFEWTNPNMVRPRLTDLEGKDLIRKRGKVEVDGIKQWVWEVIPNE